MSTPLFHAELLSNIRSITTSIYLQSPIGSSTKLSLLTPSQLQLHHDGKTSLLNLPANVAPSASLLLGKIPAIELDGTRLSYRLPVMSEPCSQQTTTSVPSENYVPWSALYLSSSPKDLSLHCKSCSSEIVSGEKISTWKDLPSGNWADMMEFWHCHKPETESKDSKVAGSKYAGLQGGYTAAKGTALVELSYFLVAEGDCGGGAVKTVETATKERCKRLCCGSCKTILGAVDADDQGSVRGWRFNKWNIKLQLSANGMCEEYSYPMVPFLSAQLLAFAEGEGIRRLIVSYDDDCNSINKETSRLKLWIFNTDIRYTSSETRRPMRAVKVFYQEVEIEDGTAAEQGTSLGDGGFEEVRLVKEMVEGLREGLRASTQGLLEELRQFREWKVGVLQRFEPENV